MKLHPDTDGMGGGSPATTETPNAGGAAPASAPAGAGGAAAAPAGKTYTEEQVAQLVREAAERRDGAWNKTLYDPEKGKDALQKLAAHFGVTLTEKEKENVAEAQQTGDESELTPREKAMLQRLDALENKDKQATASAAEQRASDAMWADIGHAAESVPYGRDPETNALVQDLILANMIDPKTPKGTPTSKIAMGIQAGLEKVFAGWAKKNGYVKDPNAAANEPLRGGVGTTAIGPSKEPKDYAEVEEQTAAMIRAARARK